MKPAKNRLSSAHKIIYASASEKHDAADGFAFVHQVEGVVDALQRHGVGDEIINVEPSFHVHIDDGGNIAATTGAAESTAAPHAPGHQLEGPGMPET